MVLGRTAVALAGVACKSRRWLEAEDLVLRHQLNILRRRASRRLPAVQCGSAGNSSGSLASLPECGGRRRNHQPQTVIRWHRHGFKAFSRWKSRSRGGHPAIPKEIHNLIREKSCANGCGCTTKSMASTWPSAPDDLVRVGRPSCVTMQRELARRTCLSSPRALLSRPSSGRGASTQGKSYSRKIGINGRPSSARAHAVATSTIRRMSEPNGSTNFEG